jgi:hypothetical protein
MAAVAAVAARQQQSGAHEQLSAWLVQVLDDSCTAVAALHCAFVPHKHAKAMWCCSQASWLCLHDLLPHAKAFQPTAGSGANALGSSGSCQLCNMSAPVHQAPSQPLPETQNDIPQGVLPGGAHWFPMQTLPAAQHCC